MHTLLLIIIGIVFFAVLLRAIFHTTIGIGQILASLLVIGLANIALGIAWSAQTLRSLWEDATW